MPIRCFLTIAFGLAAITASAEILVSSGSFVVDRTAPSAPALITPDDGATVAVAFLQLHVVAQDSTSGVAAYQFELQSAADVWQSPPVYTVWGPQSDTYLWRARARDRAGNLSDWSPLFAVNVVADPDADNDTDGLPDSWEGQYFASIEFSDGTTDSDGDGVSDAEEFVAGSHPYEFYVDVDGGWNLLSMPFNGDDTSLASLLDHGIYWRLQDGEFHRGALPVAYEGFWYYAATPATGIPVSGLPAAPHLSLLGGWNLIGPRDPMLLPANPDLSTTYSWGNRRYKTVKSDALLLPFRGYLTFAKRPTSLYLGQ